MAVPARRLESRPRRRTPASGSARRAPARRPTPVRSRPARRRSRRRAPFAVLALAVVTTMVVALVSAQALVAQGSFRISELTRRAERLERDYAVLRLEAAELSSPRRIARAARKAGLVIPSRREVLRVRGGAPEVRLVRRVESSPGSALEVLAEGSP